MKDNLKEYADNICLFLDDVSDNAREIIMIMLKSAYADGQIDALREQVEKMKAK